MKKGLGRGLSYLMGGTPIDINGAQDAYYEKVIYIPLTQIIRNPDQPRKNFNEESLAELAESIARTGVISPIIVKVKDDGYEIIAGERRFRAAQISKLEKIPAIVKNLSDTTGFEVAIIENIQREDLNIVEEAKAYRDLINKYSYNQHDVASIVGKSRSHITNILRLLTLPETVLELLEKGKITMGHSRALIGLPNAEELAKEILEKNLSVREVENLLKRKLSGTKSDTPSKERLSEHLAEIETLLSAKLKAKIKIKTDSVQKGTITIKYTSLDKLDQLLQLLGKNF